MGLNDALAASASLAKTGAAPAVSANTAKSTATVLKNINTAGERLHSGPAPVSGTLEGALDAKATFDQQRQGASGNPLENILRTGLVAAERPLQANLQALHEFSGQGLNIFNPHVIAKAIGAYGRGLTDMSGKDDTDLLRAENRDIGDYAGVGPTVPSAVPFIGGHSAGEIDAALAASVGSLALDPTMLTGGGGGSAAKAGLKAIEETGGKELAAKVAAKGVMNLSKEDQGAVESALRSSPQAAKVGPDKYVATMLGKDSPLGLGFRPGALSDRPGMKFAGQTLIPKGAISGGLGQVADVTGVTATRDALAETRAGQAVTSANDAARAKLHSSLVKPFIRRESIHSAEDLGPSVANDVGAMQRRAQSASDLKKADLVSKFNHLASVIPDADKFGRKEVLPALENGTYRDLANTLKSQGEPLKAQYVIAADKWRKFVGKEQLRTGALKESQMHDPETYVPHLPTEEAAKWLTNPANAAKVQHLGFHNPETGIFQNIGPHFRKMQGTTAEKNALMSEITHGDVKKFFEDDPIKAISRKAAATLDESAKLDVLHDLTRYDGGTGTPLAIKADAHVGPLKAFRKSIDDRVAALDKKIEAARYGKQRATLTAARTEAARKAFAAEKAVIDRRIVRLEGTLAKAHTALSAAGEAADAAKAAGKPNLGPQAAMLDRLYEIRQELHDLRWNDQDSSEAEKLFASARNALIKEQNAAKGAAGASSVQRGIGRTAAVTKYQAKITGMVGKELSALRSDSERLDTKSYRATLATPNLATHEAVIAAMRAQRKGLLGAKRDGTAQLEATAAGKPEGYVTAKLGNLGEYHMHPAVHQFFQDLEHRAAKPGAFKEFGDAIGAFSDFQRNAALNMPGFAQARMTRNFLNDLTTMWMKGFSNPQALTAGFRIAWAMRKVGKEGASFAETVAKSGLSPEDKELLQAAQHEGTLDVSQVRANVRHIGVATSKAEQRAQKLDPRYAESWWTKHSSAMNEFVNSADRLAMFADQYWKYGDSAHAAHMTDEALFNYRDLTKAEHGIRKWGAPFYTWTARNLRVQKWIISNVPQKAIAVERVKDSLANNQANGDTVDPQYSIMSGQIPLMKVGGVPILGSVQTPLEAAAQTLQPLVDIGSFAGPQKNVTQAGLGGGFAGLAQNTGNVPANAFKAGIEAFAGKDLLTGAPLPKTRAGEAAYLLESQIPRTSSLAGAVRNTAGSNATSADRVAQALKLAGVSATAVTPKRSLSELYRRNDALNAAADQAGIPTATQLKKKGKLKPAKPSSK